MIHGGHSIRTAGRETEGDRPPPADWTAQVLQAEGTDAPQRQCSEASSPSGSSQPCLRGFVPYLGPTSAETRSPMARAMR